MKVRSSSAAHDDLAERTPFGQHLESFDAAPKVESGPDMRVYAALRKHAHQFLLDSVLEGRISHGRRTPNDPHDLTALQQG